jgi:hypothetical protein
VATSLYRARTEAQAAGADRGVIRAPGFSCDVAGPLEQWRGAAAIAHEHAQRAQPLQRLCDAPVHFPERGDADFQRAFVLCLGPAIVACGPVDIPEVLDRIRHVIVCRAEARRQRGVWRVESRNGQDSG